MLSAAFKSAGTQLSSSQPASSSDTIPAYHSTAYLGAHGAYQHQPSVVDMEVALLYGRAISADEGCTYSTTPVDRHKCTAAANPPGSAPMETAFNSWAGQDWDQSDDEQDSVATACHSGRPCVASAQPFSRATSGKQLACSYPRTISAPQLQSLAHNPRHSAGDTADLAPHQLLANTASLEAALAETTSSDSEFLGPSSLRMRGSAQLRLRDGVLRATNPAFM